MPIKASCHCGAIQFEVSVAPASITECNCTFCFKRGVLWAYYKPGEVRFIANERTTVYTSDPTTHEHHHCAVCGCAAYNDGYAWTEGGGPDFAKPEIAVNARLFDRFDISQLPLRKLDGRNLW